MGIWESLKRCNRRGGEEEKGRRRKTLSLSKLRFSSRTRACWPTRFKSNEPYCFLHSSYFRSNLAKHRLVLFFSYQFYRSQTVKKPTTTTMTNTRMMGRLNLLPILCWETRDWTQGMTTMLSLSMCLVNPWQLQYEWIGEWLDNGWMKSKNRKIRVNDY